MSQAFIQIAGGADDIGTDEGAYAGEQCHSQLSTPAREINGVLTPIDILPPGQGAENAGLPVQGMAGGYPVRTVPVPWKTFPLTGSGPFEVQGQACIFGGIENVSGTPFNATVTVYDSSSAPSGKVVYTNGTNAIAERDIPPPKEMDNGIVVAVAGGSIPNPGLNVLWMPAP